MRFLKKSLAMIVALTMIISAVGVGVFAASEADADVKLAITADATSVGQGKSVIYTITASALKADTFKAGGAGITINYDSSAYSAEVLEILEGFSMDTDLTVKPGKVKFAPFANYNITSAGVTMLKIKFTVAADAPTGADKDVFTIDEGADEIILDPNGAPVPGFLTEIPKITVIKAFTVATVDAVADQTAELGDKVADVKAKLANLDINVKGADASTEVATLKATDWTCADLTTETIEAAKDYTFTGTLQGTDVVSVPDGLKTVSVKVKVGKITLTDAMVTSTYKNIEIPQTEAAASLSAADVVAKYVGSEYKTATISKDGAFEEKDATVEWTGTGTIETSKLTSEDAANKLTLSGTVTPKADGNYTGTAKTADITVTVVPAEIDGGSISINNPIDNGYVTANITVPASVIAKMPLDAEGDSDEVKAEKKAKRTISLIVPNADSTKEGATVSVEVTPEQIAAAKEADAKDLNVTLKSDKKMKELGYSSSSANKTFTVTVTVGGTQLVQKDKDGKVVPVSGEVKKATSGNAGGIHKGGSTTTTYAVTVVETKNGTATVSPEKAASGATVTVKPEPAEGYKVKSVTAVKADGTNVPVDEKAYTFTMPASAVKVTVEFEEGTEPVDPKPQEGKFVDVADDFWAAKDIYTLKDAGIIGGKSATEFDPEGDVTRAEFAKMVVGLFGYKATSDAVNFEDCKAEDWFTPYVAAGVEAGVIKGVSDTEFAPNATITREDACTILGRALNKVAQSNELKFTDADKVAEYAAPYVALLSELGYVNGYEDGSFAPTNNITRAEAAKIIAGIYNAKDSTEDKADNTDTIDVAPEK